MANDRVFDGFWINWENGRTKGATLTLPVYQGLILGSFLTLYVQFSGVCFWRVICFMLHQLRSTTLPRDGLFHQQQAILRNAITAPNALWSFVRSSRAWRNNTNTPIRSSMPLLLITTVHIAFFAVAGLFSQQVMTTGASPVLVRQGKCGLPIELPNVHNAESADFKSEEELLTFNTEVLLGRLTLTKSAYYVRSCYHDDVNADASTCNKYIQPHLTGVNASALLNASCPFGDDACATAAARFDSGFVHSGEDLGMNFPHIESLSMRRVTTCAPIRSDEAYSTEWREGVHEALVGRTNTSVRYYEFGNGTKGCEGTNKTTDLTTFCVTQYQKDNFQVPYTVRGATAYHNNNSASDFEPIAAFRVPDADTTLLSIMSTAKYTGNVTDPLFNALNRSVVSQQVFFESTHDLNVLGCTEQYQFCNLGNGRCTALTGLYGIQQAFEIGDLSLNAKQSAMFQVMWKATWAMGLQWASKLLSDNLLLAKDWAFTAIAQTSSALPPDQWQSEAYNIHNLSLAVFQRRINEYAKPESFEIRPGVNSLNQLVEPTDPEMRALCGLQKIRSSDHYSVSILGMSIILVVGGVLILLDWILVQQIFWFRSVTHARQAKKADWTNTGTLQLYRQALESRGVGPWKVKDFEFPVLLSRNYTFMGLGSQHDPATQLHRMDSGDWAQQHTAYMPEHAVPQYTALTPQTPDMEGEIQVLGESKSSDGKLR